MELTAADGAPASGAAMNGRGIDDRATAGAPGEAPVAGGSPVGLPAPRWRGDQGDGGGAAAARAERLSTLSYAVVDVETTGGSPWTGHRVTEVAAVVVRDGRVAHAYETLVNPERSIPPYIVRLTHITSAMVRDKPTFRDICPRLVDVLGGHVFVAHNAAFDWGFVCAELSRAGWPLPAGRRLCTVRLARRLLPHLRRRSLDHVAHHYGVAVTDRHRAMGDAMATAHCLLRLLDDAGSRGLDTWGDVDRLLAARRRCPRRASALPRTGEWEIGA